MKTLSQAEGRVRVTNVTGFSMDSLITAAAHALSAGDPRAAVKMIALRDDPSALALRGIAMAQLGDLSRARELLRSAVRTFGPKESTARARCVVAENALVSRDRGQSLRTLNAARSMLEASGDRTNAAHVGYLEARQRHRRRPACSSSVVVLLIVCIGIPLAYSWRVLRLDMPSKGACLLFVADAAVFVALVLLVGRWDMAGYYTRFLLLAVFLAAALMNGGTDMVLSQTERHLFPA